MAHQKLKSPRNELDLLANATLNFTRRSLFNILHARKVLPDESFERDNKGEFSGLKSKLPSLRPAIDALNDKSLVETVKNKALRRMTVCLQSNDSEVADSLIEAYTYEYKYKDGGVNVSIHEGKKSVAKGVQFDLQKVREDYKSRLAEVHAAAAEIAVNPRLVSARANLDKGKNSLCMVVRLDVVKGTSTLDDTNFIDDSEGETVEIMRESASKVGVSKFDTPTISSEVSLFSPTPLLEPPVASSGARIMATQINVSSIDVPEEVFSTDVSDSEQPAVVVEKGKKRKRNEIEKSPGGAQRAVRVSAPESEPSRERAKLLLRLKEKVTAPAGKEIGKKYDKKVARATKPAATVAATASAAKDIVKTSKKRPKLNTEEE